MSEQSVRYRTARQILCDPENQPSQGVCGDVTYLARCDDCEDVVAARGTFAQVDRVVRRWVSRHDGHRIEEADNE